MQQSISFKMMLLLAVFLFFWRSSGAQALDRVVVIPMGSAKTLQNVITVAKSNGKFTDPVAAVNSITDASATNPYLVLIAPGIYTLTTAVVMKPYIDISGTGENVTVLTGAISNGSFITSAIIKGANHATLSNLSVSNTGGDSFSIGIYTEGLDSSARLQQVSVTVSGGFVNYGIVNTNSSPIMTGVNTDVSGGMGSVGVENDTNSSPTMTGVNTAVSGGETSNVGIANYDNSSPIMTEVNTVASGGTNNFGVYNGYNSSPRIRRSTLSGATNGLANSGSSSTATISQSTIINGVFGTVFTCVACDNGSGIALSSACL